MPKLILARHLKSKWNKEFRFSGWVDMSLCKEGIKDAERSAKKIFKKKIDAAYTSPLFRNQDTCFRILSCVGKYPIFVYLDKGRMKDWGKYVDISKDDLPVFTAEDLNERYYGKLQGLNKNWAMKKFGKEQVHVWRRSYDVRPPGGESLKDVVKRTTRFYRKYAEKDLKKGKNVLIVASHNSLRAIIKYVENVPDNEIINVEVPYGGILEYDFGKGMKLRKKIVLK